MGLADHLDQPRRLAALGDRPVDLRPHIERAFARPHVSIDFAGFSGETLDGVVREPLDKIRVGLLAPETIAIRLLLPDTQRPMGLPCRTGTLDDDPEFRARATGIMARHSRGIMDSLAELVELGLVRDASARIRVYRCAPLFKLYLFGDDEAFFGFYPVREHTLTLDGEPRSVYDLICKDALLFHHVRTSARSSPGSRFVEQARTWFDSMWSQVGREFTP